MMCELIRCQCQRWQTNHCHRLADAEDLLCTPCREGCALLTLYRDDVCDVVVERRAHLEFGGAIGEIGVVSRTPGSFEVIG